MLLNIKFLFDVYRFRCYDDTGGRFYVRQCIKVEILHE